MKIGSDFVTNSSSSSYCIEISIVDKNDKAYKYSLNSADYDGGRIEFTGYIDAVASQKSVADICNYLTCHLHDDYYETDNEVSSVDEYQPKSEKIAFEKKVTKNIKSISDIKKVVIAEIGYSEGDQTDFDVECDIFDSINAVAKIYPNLNRDNYASFPSLLSDVEKILSHTETLKDNDPEEFVLDYIDSFADAPYGDERTGFDPYKSIEYHAFDLENNRIIDKRMAFSGYDQVFSDNLDSDIYKKRLNSESGPSGDTIVTIAKIRLSATSRGKIYDYICEVDNVSVGDNVTVEGQEGFYSVLGIEHKTVKELLLPFNYYKKVLAKQLNQSHEKSESNNSKSKGNSSAKSVQPHAKQKTSTASSGKKTSVQVNKDAEGKKLAKEIERKYEYLTKVTRKAFEDNCGKAAETGTVVTVFESTFDRNSYSTDQISEEIFKLFSDELSKLLKDSCDKYSELKCDLSTEVARSIVGTILRQCSSASSFGVQMTRDFKLPRGIDFHLNNDATLLKSELKKEYDDLKATN